MLCSLFYAISHIVGSLLRSSRVAVLQQCIHQIMLEFIILKSIYPTLQFQLWCSDLLQYTESLAGISNNLYMFPMQSTETG